MSSYRTHPVLVSVALALSVTSAERACCFDNGCNYANDGMCDDGGPGAEYDECLGNDCADCNPAGCGSFPPAPPPTPARPLPEHCERCLTVFADSDDTDSLIYEWARDCGCVDIFITGETKIINLMMLMLFLLIFCSALSASVQPMYLIQASAVIVACTGLYVLVLFPTVEAVGIPNSEFFLDNYVCELPSQSLFRHVDGTSLASNFLLWFARLSPLIPAVVGTVSLVVKRRGLARRIKDMDGAAPELLKNGTIRLLKISWLLEQAGDAFLLRRRQDLDAAAFVPHDEAVEMLRANQIAALS